jgi:hypothetical protein
LDVSESRPEDKKLMAKSQRTGSAHPGSPTRDRSSEESQRDEKKPPKERRKILFPTEPTSIPREEIDRAIDLVMSRKK